jgi:hypothetical protein
MLLVCVRLAGGVSVDARRIQYAVVFPSMSIIIFVTRIKPNTALPSCKLRTVGSTQLHKCDYHEGSGQLKSGIDGQIKIEVAKFNDYWGGSLTSYHHSSRPKPLLDAAFVKGSMTCSAKLPLLSNYRSVAKACSS